MICETAAPYIAQMGVGGDDEPHKEHVRSNGPDGETAWLEGRSWVELLETLKGPMRKSWRVRRLNIPYIYIRSRGGESRRCKRLDVRIR